MTTLVRRSSPLTAPPLAPICHFTSNGVARSSLDGALLKLYDRWSWLAGHCLKKPQQKKEKRLSKGRHVWGAGAGRKIAFQPRTKIQISFQARYQQGGKNAKRHAPPASHSTLWKWTKSRPYIYRFSWHQGHVSLNVNSCASFVTRTSVAIG